MKKGDKVIDIVSEITCTFVRPLNANQSIVFMPDSETGGGEVLVDTRDLVMVCESGDDYTDIVSDGGMDPRDRFPNIPTEIPRGFDAISVPMLTMLQSNGTGRYIFKDNVLTLIPDAKVQEIQFECKLSVTMDNDTVK